MNEQIIIAGSGGQGIMLVGKLIAEAARLEARHVTWLPCYGAEVRGGAAYCMVVISDQEIGSPYIEKADTLIIMNGPSLNKFKKRIKNKGLLLVNTSLADISGEKDGTAWLGLPFTDIAVRLGNIRVANTVALGAYVARKRIIGAKSAFRAIASIAPADKRALIQINKEAVLAGMRLAGGRF